ncbi:Alpha/Beta hydrolase protein [Corynascus similis CBS 632.67]
MTSRWWIAGLALVGSFASCAPNVPRSSASDTDIATRFVADVLADVRQAEQQRQHERSPPDLGHNNPLVVNLGYAKYRGYHDASTGLNYWKGLRYAAPPTGKLRFQPPQPLPLNSSSLVTDAVNFGPICPQLMPSVPNAPFLPGNEDCLFLNVYAPSKAANLPVLVYIHEGGYGLGDGTHDMTEIINANDNGFVAVTFQYRLGAFGWLSSGEVKKRGAVNAGMLDQVFALAWVKLHIRKFGGDPNRVTIAGESAGGGSVLYHSIALRGKLGSLLYSQGIAASPYLVAQYKYDDTVPTSRYYAFSQAAGCPSSGDVFDCIVSKDTDMLQQASFAVTQQSVYGTWGFGPVTDQAYIMNRPTQQFAARSTNGQRLLVGHNANEGGLFVPTLTTTADLANWLQTGQFPNLTPLEIETVLAANPNDMPTTTDPSSPGPLFETDGVSGGNRTAVHVSQTANGQQQRGYNIYAEATFACPAYWLASAYSESSSSSGDINTKHQQQSAAKAWLYQYSVPFALHGADVAGYFGPATPNQPAEFTRAFRRIWGDFIRFEDPSRSVSAEISLPKPPANAWPVWRERAPTFLNLNTTGGTAYQTGTPWGTNVTQFEGPGVQNAFSLADAATWEGGRKGRCDVYLRLADSVPF